MPTPKTDIHQPTLNMRQVWLRRLGPLLERWPMHILMAHGADAGKATKAATHFVYAG
jgi:hypothetical protein